MLSKKLLVDLVFFWRCFPDGQGVFNPITKNVLCNGIKSVINEGHKSFPGGHTWSFAWFSLARKIKAFDQRGHIAKLCIVFAPLLAASLVAVSRVDDYWHHWQDVFTGRLIARLNSGYILLPAILPRPIQYRWLGSACIFLCPLLAPPPIMSSNNQHNLRRV